MELVKLPLIELARLPLIELVRQLLIELGKFILVKPKVNIKRIFNFTGTGATLEVTTG